MAVTRYCRVTSEVLWRLPENWRQNKALGARLGYPFTDQQLAVMLVEILEAEPLARIDLGRLPAASHELKYDYGKACAADALIQAGQSGMGAGSISAENTEALGFELLSEVAAAPAASPMLFYDELCGDLGLWRLRQDDVAGARAAFRRAVAANLALQDGTSVASYLADLGRATLQQDRAAGFAIIATVLEHDPDTLSALDQCALYAGGPVAKAATERVARQVGDLDERYKDLRIVTEPEALPPELQTRLLAALQGSATRRSPRDLIAAAAPEILDQPFALDLPEVAVPERPGARKVGRNDPCWCGSGKKYKKCHLGKD